MTMWQVPSLLHRVTTALKIPGYTPRFPYCGILKVLILLSDKADMTTTYDGPETQLLFVGGSSSQLSTHIINSTGDSFMPLAGEL